MKKKDFSKGTYEVYWENTSSNKEIISIIDNTEYSNINEFLNYVKTKVLEDFDKFTRDVRCKFLYPLEEVEEFIIIVNYDNAYKINLAISKGYAIREFVKDKCVLEKKVFRKI